MNIKSDFNSEIKKLTIKKLQEPTLVKCLVKALNNNGIEALFCHQKYIKYNRCGASTKRELCDLLVIIKYLDYYRISFVQSKKNFKPSYKGLGNITIDCGQHCLLVTKPIISINGVQTDFLSNAIYDTVTTYSIFYRDKIGEMDLDLSSACSVICSGNNYFSSCSGKKSTARHLYTALNFNKKNKNVDYDSHICLNEIQCNYHFGEVVLNSDLQRIQYLKKIINTFKIDKEKISFELKSDNNHQQETNNGNNHYIIKKLLFINLSNIPE